MVEALLWFVVAFCHHRYPLIQTLPLMSYQSGCHTGLTASTMCHRFRRGHGEWRDAHLQPDAHEESVSVDERPEEVRCSNCGFYRFVLTWERRGRIEFCKPERTCKSSLVHLACLKMSAVHYFCLNWTVAFLKKRLQLQITVKQLLANLFCWVGMFYSAHAWQKRLWAC